jgi:hypothetical protein
MSSVQRERLDLRARAVEFVRREHPEAENIETELDRDETVFVRFKVNGRTKAYWYASTATH